MNFNAEILLAINSYGKKLHRAITQLSDFHAEGHSAYFTSGGNFIE